MFLYKWVAAIYKMYEFKGLDIPHFRAITTVVLLLIFHIGHIVLIFNVDSRILMFWSDNSSKDVKWLFGILYLSILLFLVSTIFKKRILDQIEITPSVITRTKLILQIYFFFSIALLVTLLILHGIQEGKIT